MEQPQTKLTNAMNWIELIITHLLALGLGMTFQSLKDTTTDADRMDSPCAIITIWSLILLGGYELSRFLTP